MPVRCGGGRHADASLCAAIEAVQAELRAAGAGGGSVGEGGGGVLDALAAAAAAADEAALAVRARVEVGARARAPPPPTHTHTPSNAGVQVPVARIVGRLFEIASYGRAAPRLARGRGGSVGAAGGGSVVARVVRAILSRDKEAVRARCAPPLAVGLTAM